MDQPAQAENSNRLNHFLKGGLARLGVLGVMLGAGRQLAQAHGAQFAAQRLLADRNAKFLEHPVRQIDISSS